MTMDLISREAAIDAIYACHVHGRNLKKFCEKIGKTDAYSDGILESVNAVEDLPAIETAPIKHGQWVKPTGMMPPEYHGHYECSACGFWATRDWLRPWKEVVLSNYCPNCGAKMEGQQ